MKTSQNGIDFIKKHEGLRLTAYPDGSSYSVGYGHNGVAKGTTISEAEAERLLRADLDRFEAAVNKLGLELSQSQFDALVSLAYNAGPGAVQGNLYQLLKSSTRPRAELKAWWTQHYISSNGKQLDVLVRRRAEEYSMYEEGSGKGAAAMLVPACGMLCLLGLLYMIV